MPTFHRVKLSNGIATLEVTCHLPAPNPDYAVAEVLQVYGPAGWHAVAVDGVPIAGAVADAELCDSVA